MLSFSPSSMIESEGILYSKGVHSNDLWEVSLQLWSAEWMKNGGSVQDHSMCDILRLTLSSIPSPRRDQRAQENYWCGVRAKWTDAIIQTVQFHVIVSFKFQYCSCQQECTRSETTHNNAPIFRPLFCLEYLLSASNPFRCPLFFLFLNYLL